MAARDERRAATAAELGIDLDPLPPSPALAITAEQLTAIVTAAVQAAGMGGGSDVGAQITQALRDNRQPIPENTDADYHGRSHYNPEGKAGDRQPLAQDVFLGVWDQKTGQATGVFPVPESVCTNVEIDALNRLVPGVYTVTRNDGATVPAHVVDQKDDHDRVLRRVVAFPQVQFTKETFNTLPPMKTGWGIHAA